MQARPPLYSALAALASPSSKVSSPCNFRGCSHELRGFWGRSGLVARGCIRVHRSGRGPRRRPPAGPRSAPGAQWARVRFIWGAPLGPAPPLLETNRMKRTDSVAKAFNQAAGGIADQPGSTHRQPQGPARPAQPRGPGPGCPPKSSGPTQPEVFPELTRKQPAGLRNLIDTPRR